MNSDTTSIEEGIRKPLVWLTLLFGVAFVVRACWLDEQSFSNDEVIELEDAREPWNKIVWDADGFPPLHRLLLGAVLRIGGDAWARWPSVWLGALCVPVVFWFLHRHRSPLEASWAALAVAFSPIMVYYSQEARAYPVYLIAAALVLWWGWEAIKSDSRCSWLMLVLFSVIGSYSHYYLPLTITAVFVVWLIQRWPSRQYLRGTVAAVCIWIGFIPLLFLLKSDLELSINYPTSNEVSLAALAYTYYSFIGGYTLGPNPSELHEFSATQAVQAVLPWLLVWCVVLAGPLLAALRGLFKDRLFFSYLVTTALLPVALSAVLAICLDLSYNVRYSVVSALPLLAIIGIGIGSTRGFFWRLAFGLSIISLFILGHVRRYSEPDYRTEDVRSTAAFLQKEAPRADVPAFVVTAYMHRTLGYCLPSSFPLNPLHEYRTKFTSPDDVDRAAAIVYEAADKNDGCRIVVTRAFHGDPQFLFRKWLEKEPRAKLEAEFPGVRVYWVE